MTKQKSITNPAVEKPQKQVIPASSTKSKKTDAQRYRGMLCKMLNGPICPIIENAAQDAVITGMVMDKKYAQLATKFRNAYAALLKIADELSEEQAKNIRTHSWDMDDACFLLFSHGAEQMFELMFDRLVRPNSIFQALIGGAE